MRKNHEATIIGSKREQFNLPLAKEKYLGECDMGRCIRACKSPVECCYHEGKEVVYGFSGEGVLFPPLAIVSLARQEGSCDRIRLIVS